MFNVYFVLCHEQLIPIQYLFWNKSPKICINFHFSILWHLCRPEPIVEEDEEPTKEPSPEPEPIEIIKEVTDENKKNEFAELPLLFFDNEAEILKMEAAAQKLIEIDL